jgi:hypothetical protein
MNASRADCCRASRNRASVAPAERPSPRFSDVSTAIDSAAAPQLCSEDAGRRPRVSHVRENRCYRKSRGAPALPRELPRASRKNTVVPPPRRSPPRTPPRVAHWHTSCPILGMPALLPPDALHVLIVDDEPLIRGAL